MPSCCGGAGCTCRIVAGSGVAMSGTGSANDPFVLSVDVALAVTDTSVFDLTLSGAGTVASPWALSVNYAATATLNDIPDVNVTSATNGQVLSWDDATDSWVPITA